MLGFDAGHQFSTSPGDPYSAEPHDAETFTARFDRLYSRLARPYDLAVKLLPVWRHWISAALPHIRGPRVLEVSFGTGWLLTRYASKFDTYGVDLNERMVAIARRNLHRAGVTAELRQANVEALPFPDGHFDSVVNTMAFSGYPNGQRAMSELHRVLRRQGRLVLIDVGYPRDGNRLGCALVGMWKRSGDVIRNMPPLFNSFGFDVYHEQIGGFGSVHLYVATKREDAATRMRKGKDEAWLLVKRNDEDADARRNPLRSQPKSVLSGHTLDDLS